MEAGKAAWEDQPEFYHEEKGWMRPLRTSLRLSLLPGFFIIFGSLIVFGRVAGSDGSRVIVMTMLFGMIGAYLATIIAMCAVISSIRLSRSDGWLFVRWRGILWRVDLNRLNRMRPYQFTRKTGALLALAWSRLNPEEQEQAKASAFRAIRDMSGGQVTGSIAVRAVLPLTDLRLIKENQWGWRVSYLAANGRKQQVTIAKAYSGLRPVPETEPARGPVPRRWGLVAVMLLLAVLLATLGGIVGYGAAGGFDTVRRPKAAEARIPDNTTAYEQYGVSYLVDSTFRNQGDGLFYDPETNASYSVSVWFDVDEEDAVDRLLQPISDYRMDENFDSFRFEHAGAETTLVPLTAADGSIFQYEILSVYFKDGQTLHTGAALSENGILVLVEVSHEDKRDEDEVKGSLLFILESVEIGEVS